MEDIKIIAYYLSQFHQIPENDKWWGKGFTEWVNTKKAKPLFRGHEQPKIPLNRNYYDLSNISVMEEQVKLAKESGIYGFCFYHYWFKGKLLLEKPIEQYLAHSEINFPFCFMWANESWTRTWDGVDGQKNVLIKQSYSEEDWGMHFEYLLPYFKDQRYICKDGKPIFLIYKARNIPQCGKMLIYWNQLALENGLKGIYFIQADSGHKISSAGKIDASVFFEPRRTADIALQHRSKWQYSKVLKPFNRNPYIARRYYPAQDYNKIYQELIAHAKKYSHRRYYYGAFVNWDNTARKGENGDFFYNSSPEIFEKYLKQLVRMSKKDGKEFLFLFAWNEWAEGAYLEPDERYGYAYLNAVKRVIDERKEDDYE